MIIHILWYMSPKMNLQIYREILLLGHYSDAYANEQLILGS